MDSGSGGAIKSSLKPEWPATDSAAAINQLSNSRLASTTPTGRPVSGRAFSPRQHEMGKFFRATVVAVHDDQHKSGLAKAPDRELYCIFESSVAQQPALGYPDRALNVRVDRRIRECDEAANQDRDSLNFAVAFHYASYGKERHLLRNRNFTLRGFAGLAGFR